MELARFIVILDLRMVGIGRLGKRDSGAHKKKRSLLMIRVGWCERAHFEDDMAVKLDRLAVKCHRGGNYSRKKHPEGKCICYI